MRIPRLLRLKYVLLACLALAIAGLSYVYFFRTEMDIDDPPETELRPLNEVLRDWKYAKRITIDLSDVPFADVADELERQSGVAVDRWHGKKIVSLKVKDAPLWQALAQVSICLDEPIWIVNKQIHFNSVGGYVCPRYQVIGPFLIGVHWSDKLLQLESEKDVSALVIQAHSFPNEGETKGQLNSHGSGFYGAILEEPNGIRHELAPINLMGQSHLGYFRVPQELLKKKLKLLAKFEGEVYLNPQQLTLPAKAGHVARFEHFGGLKIRVKEASDARVILTVEWDSLLRGKDAREAAIWQKRSKTLNRPPTEKDIILWQKWYKAKADRMRVLHFVEATPLDKEGKIIEIDGYAWDTEISTMELKVLMGKGAAPEQLRITLAESRLAQGTIEFDDVFSAKSQ